MRACRSAPALACHTHRQLQHACRGRQALRSGGERRAAVGLCRQPARDNRTGRGCRSGSTAAAAHTARRPRPPATARRRRRWRRLMPAGGSLPRPTPPHAWPAPQLPSAPPRPPAPASEPSRAHQPPALPLQAHPAPDGTPGRLCAWAGCAWGAAAGRRGRGGGGAGRRSPPRRLPPAACRRSSTTACPVSPPGSRRLFARGQQSSSRGCRHAGNGRGRQQALHGPGRSRHAPPDRPRPAPRACEAP